jgi:murein DD-endopeptidase MepM/ murein hydrolase activator NlpD
MIRWQRLATCILAVVWATGSAGTAAGQQSGENFTYHSPGVMTFPGDLGVRDRRVFQFFPLMKFPLRVGPEAGPDGKPLRAFANSQVYRPDGFEVNDQRLYVYPWIDTLCESKHSGGPMPVCPKTPRHQGVDIRPNLPTNRFYDVVAWADGKTSDVVVSGTSQVRIRSTENGTACLYLHLMPLVGNGQDVRKGDVIGKVSNLMSGGGTSIHLHFECTATHPDTGRKVEMPIYAALVAAYRHEWGLTDSVENDALLRDPERELETGTAPMPSDPTCTEPMSAPLQAVKDRPFIARYLHNCSEMGLALDALTQEIKLIYIRPKQSLQQAAERKPVLVSGTLKAGGEFAGEAINFNRSCGDPSFKVAGHVDTNDTQVTLQGDRQVLDSQCKPANVRHETLHFARLDASSNPPPHTDPPPLELNCPFALAPGQQPQVVGGREIPPKSERSCNFTALTVPGGLSFNEMPRYIREWPGVRKDVLIDKFEDQIITFQSAETGIGAWWYWLMQRAVNGDGLAKRGFGPTGRPSLAAVARAIAGGDRSEEFVRKTYLAPYLAFASEFFGRVVAESEPIDLSDSNARWNLARTMFRLESGRTPVVSRKQFECGVKLGTDVADDFAHAGVEASSASPVNFVTFQGLKFYIDTCTVPDTVTNPPPAAGTLAEALMKLATANQQIQVLNQRVTELLRDKTDRDRQLQLVNEQVSALQRRLAELTQPPDPGQRVRELERQIAELTQTSVDLKKRFEQIKSIIDQADSCCGTSPGKSPSIEPTPTTLPPRSGSSRRGVSLHTTPRTFGGTFAGMSVARTVSTNSVRALSSDELRVMRRARN